MTIGRKGNRTHGVNRVGTRAHAINVYGWKALGPCPVKKCQAKAGEPCKPTDGIHSGSRWDREYPHKSRKLLKAQRA